MRTAVIIYTVALIVLVAVAFLVAAWYDQVRGREIERDLTQRADPATRPRRLVRRGRKAGPGGSG